MITGQNEKTVAFGTLGAIATNATSNHYVDTWDSNGVPFEHARIFAIAPVAAATNSSAKWTSMVLKDSKVTNVSSATAISGATGTTSATATTAQFVLPAHNDTAVKSVVVFDVGLPTRERYLHLTVQAASADASTCAFVAQLSRAKSSPTTAAGQGAAAIVYL